MVTTQILINGGVVLCHCETSSAEYDKKHPPKQSPRIMTQGKRDCFVPSIEAHGTIIENLKTARGVPFSHSTLDVMRLCTRIFL